MTSGVYLITNAITGAKYVGQSTNIERRIIEHKTPNSSKSTKSKRFIDDIERFGISNFRFDILEECSPDQLLERERYWIAKLQPEYNTVGKPVSSETAEKIRKSCKAYWSTLSDEQKQKIISRNLKGPRPGHIVSAETRRKIRARLTGTSKFAVRVVETGAVYRSAEECAKALGCTRGSVYNQLQGRTKITKGYHLERVETNCDECSSVGRR